MLEWIPLIIAGGALIPNTLPMNEKKRIIQVFENTDFCVKREGEKLHPIFIRKTENETAKIYYFEMPLGLDLADHPKLVDRLCSSLNRNIEVKGDSILEVWVYKVSLPLKWDYDELPDVEGWQVPIGKTFKEIIWHDFDKTPHMTIAGTTRFGKSVLLKTIMTYLIEHHPDDVEFYIVDMKRLEFSPFRNLKQVKEVATNFESAYKMMMELNDKMENLMVEFEKKKVRNIVNSPIKKRTFILVDEAARLTPNPSFDKDINKKLKRSRRIMSEIAGTGGGIGMRLVYATQYPTAQNLDPLIKQNADAKISFRLPTEVASRVAIDEGGAELIDRVGKAIYKTHDRIIVQAPFLDDIPMEDRLRRWEVDTTSEEVRETREDIIKFR